MQDIPTNQPTDVGGGTPLPTQPTPPTSGENQGGEPTQPTQPITPPPATPPAEEGNTPQQ